MDISCRTKTYNHSIDHARDFVKGSPPILYPISDSFLEGVSPSAFSLFQIYETSDTYVPIYKFRCRCLSHSHTSYTVSLLTQVEAFA